jgi:hypothetical protein
VPGLGIWGTFYEQVNKLAHKWEDYLNGLDQGGFYHETPIYYLTPFLIPDSLKDRLDGDQLLKIEQRLEHVINFTDSGSCYYGYANDKKFDWNAAKQRVEMVLNEFGETLESIQYPVIVKASWDKYPIFTLMNKNIRIEIKKE